MKEVVKDDKVTFEYDIDKNQDIAKNLKGKLLLITGDIDNNVHPSNTYRVVDALIRANKRFDFILLPGQRHGFATDRRLRVLAPDRLLLAAPARLGRRSDTDMLELERERQIRR